MILRSIYPRKNKAAREITKGTAVPVAGFDANRSWTVKILLTCFPQATGNMSRSTAYSTSCGVRFIVDKPPVVHGHQCPCCGLSSQIVADKKELAVLKEALDTLKPQVVVSQVVVKAPKPNNRDGGDSLG